MAVSSLTRMTVPLASDQSSPTQGLLMPKLKYRYRVVFENLGVSTPRTELTKQVMTFNRPTINFEEIEVPIYNSRIYLAGRQTWDAVAATFRDDAGGNVSRLVGEQIQKQMDTLEQASASSGIDYKFTTRCEVLDGGNGTSTPNVLETWELYGCFLQSTNYGDLDYASNDPVTIEITMRYDNAVQTPLGTGIGSTVGRTLGDVVTG
tara:strand:+ start:1062 stop:1679 length:618 start_codon:yes stop_codon:yes gene_type:complete